MKKYILLAFFGTFMLSGCRYMWGKRVTGNGVIKTAEHPVGDFRNVEVHGDIKVYVSQGPVKPVRVEADENLLEYIEVVQTGDRIEIGSRRGYNLEPSHDNKIKIFVTAPVYNEIEVSGACDIIGEMKITNPEKLMLGASGAGSISMDLDAPAVSAEISGAGSIDLRGQTKSADLEISGAGKAHCFDLLSESTRVEISGAGSAEVFASLKLSAEVSGAGSVTYKGGATDINQHVSGAGSISKAN